MTALLAIQAAVRQDTLVAVSARDAYDLVFVLAAGAGFLVFVGAVLLVVYLLLQIRRATKAVQKTKERISLDPGIESLRNVAKNFEAISRTIQEEAGRLSKSVSQVSDRLTQASDRMEERIEDFNAFLEVVQQEAEGAFIESASRARGVRAGLGSLGHRTDGRPPGSSDEIRAHDERDATRGVTRGSREDEGPAASDEDLED